MWLKLFESRILSMAADDGTGQEESALPSHSSAEQSASYRHSPEQWKRIENSFEKMQSIRREVSIGRTKQIHCHPEKHL